MDKGQKNEYPSNLGQEPKAPSRIIDRFLPMPSVWMSFAGVIEGLSALTHKDYPTAVSSFGIAIASAVSEFPLLRLVFRRVDRRVDIQHAESFASITSVVDEILYRVIIEDANVNFDMERKMQANAQQLQYFESALIEHMIWNKIKVHEPVSRKDIKTTELLGAERLIILMQERKKEYSDTNNLNEGYWTESSLDNLARQLAPVLLNFNEELVDGFSSFLANRYSQRTITSKKQYDENINDDEIRRRIEEFKEIMKGNDTLSKYDAAHTTEAFIDNAIAELKDL